MDIYRSNLLELKHILLFEYYIYEINIEIKAEFHISGLNIYSLDGTLRSFKLHIWHLRSLRMPIKDVRKGKG